MSTSITSGKGNLLSPDNLAVIGVVDYTIWETPQRDYTLGEWHGSFVPEEEHLFVKGEYVLELQDRRKGKIIITNINVRTGTTNYYRFQGSGSLA